MSSATAVDALVCETHLLSAARVSRMLPVLSEDERERQGRFAFAEDRRDYVAAHALLRVALAARTGAAPDRLRFHATPRGQPFLLPARDGPPVPSFSITHSRGLVACAIGPHGRVGVDAESVEACVRAVEVAQRVFSPAEAAALGRLPAEERAAHVCELWTLKESFAKAIGLGLEQPLTRPSFAVSGARLTALGAPGWLFVLTDVGVSHKLAVAADSRAEVRFWLTEALALTRGELRAIELAGTVATSATASAAPAAGAAKVRSGNQGSPSRISN